ncbi:MAG TPA: flagellar motor protein MotB [Candidatus Aquilonibacter sp.]|nr:flagellar motor protein MotB [Candidatus Aquilonibacter sp.]
MTNKPPIIVIKKKGGHGGHHGGAWKVAYADFVTAMMALFIVLWLLNSSKKIQDAVGGYFRDPQGTADKAGKDIVGSAAASIVPADNMEQLKQQLEKAIAGIPNFDKLKSHIEMTITPEGLRIELIEGANGTFFDSGSPNLNTDGQDILKALAGELGKLPNRISVEGHTDAKPYAEGSNYGNWELSSDRANAARRLIQSNGVGPQQVTEVRGFADMRLRNPKDPFDPSNRRISLVVHYLDSSGAASGETQSPTPAANSLPANLPGATTVQK